MGTELQDWLVYLIVGVALGWLVWRWRRARQAKGGCATTGCNACKGAIQRDTERH
jgi:hypothetical protein